MREKINQLNINSETGSVRLNGAEINKSISKLEITWEGGKLPVVKMEMDSQVILDGTMLTRKVGNLCCEKCGYKLGEFAGQCSVVCPQCGELNIGYF